MLKRLSLFMALGLVALFAVGITGCGGGDSSDPSTTSGGLYSGPACEDDVSSSGCIEEVEEKTGDAVEQGEDALSEEQEQDQEEFENEEGIYGSEEEAEAEEVDPSDSVKPPSEKE